MKIEEITNDKFLKDMKVKELNECAKDIRLFLLDNISKTGGHLSSNLGDVELIMALHKEFDFNGKDMILFDVGHQAYTHKILNGKANDFTNLRKIDGISGFIRNRENENDIFESGHSSTSLSTAMGLAKARDLNNENYEIVVFIGDASIANGVAFEALNQLSTFKSKVIVVLNDNGMSINQSVGTTAKVLSRWRTSGKYGSFKNGMVKFFSHFKHGIKFINFVERHIHRLVLIFRSDNIFDNFKIAYSGPIDGHDFDDLEAAFKRAKHYPNSILIHVKTKKGKGYELAEKDTTGYYHNVLPFNLENGKSEPINDGKVYFSQAVANSMFKLMKNNEDVILISAAMVSSTKLTECFDAYPNRCIDVGISEEHAICLANGLALNKKLPVISMYSTFLQRGYDEIVHDVCRINSNVLFLVDKAGIVGEDGDTHQGMFDTSFVYPLENAIICEPSRYEQVDPLINMLINIKGTKFIRYCRDRVLENTNVCEFEFGKFIIDSYDEDNIASIIVVGNSFNKIKQLINEYNLKINIIDALFLKPLDTNTLDKIASKPIYIYDNTSVYEGFISSCYKYLSKYHTKITSYCLPNEFIKHGQKSLVLKSLKLDPESIFELIKEDLGL